MEKEEEYLKFRASVLNLHDSRTHKVTGSLGVYSAYKYIRKNKWLNLPKPLTEHEFYSIIRKVNKCLAEELIKGNDIVFPCRMGKLEIRKHTSIIKFKEGKLVPNLPINWDATLKLWYEDKDSYNNRQLVFEEAKEVFKVLYNVQDANYNNKSFFEFKVNRDIKVELKHKIKEKALDAFIVR